MPKRVDHQERREKILQAFFEYATKEGLHNVTLRGIATQADISLRLVQYYFGTKDELIQAGLEKLENQSFDKLNESLSSLENKSALNTLSILFKEAMPKEDDSKQFHLLWMSYSLLSITSPLPLKSHILDSPNHLQEYITEILNNGILSKELKDDLNIEIEAVTILGLINGLGTAILLGQQNLEITLSVFNNHIKQLKNDSI